MQLAKKHQAAACSLLPEEKIQQKSSMVEIKNREGTLTNYTGERQSQLVETKLILLKLNTTNSPTKPEWHSNKSNQILNKYTFPLRSSAEGQGMGVVVRTSPFHVVSADLSF